MTHEKYESVVAYDIAKSHKSLFCFSYHYKLPFDVYVYTFNMCNNKTYLLTYLLYIVRFCLRGE